MITPPAFATSLSNCRSLVRTTQSKDSLVNAKWETKKTKKRPRGRVTYALGRLF